MLSENYYAINNDNVLTNVDNQSQLVTGLTIQCASDLVSLTLSKVCGSEIVSDMLQGDQLTRRYVAFLFLDSLRKKVKETAINL